MLPKGQGVPPTLWATPRKLPGVSTVNWPYERGLYTENGELFGKERLVAFIRENAGLGAEEIIEKLKGQLVDFRGVSPQKDDMTIAVLKVENQPPSIK
ncbi:SpoIIE family protein phosphatase [Pseudodesulfovibrio profundus]|uniref:SpoIIE family protein phosphatase n=1 Tax=Pseudodesulfovibrio profundus TaxID=57320 RepID=UPI00389ADB68